jgi:hypothetical protein
MSSYLFSVDPGLRTAGVAMFRDSVLIHAGLARSEEEHARGPAAWLKMGEAVAALVASWTDGTTFAEQDTMEIVCELMQVYGRAVSAADPADLMELMGVNGVIISQFDGAKACGYRPAEWKKSVPKSIHNQRILNRLTHAETKVLDNDPTIIPSLRHNAVDAVGIGLHHLLRLRTPGLKARGAAALPEELQDE